MKKISSKRKILLLLILIWIIFSFLSVFYNAIKSVSEAKEWIPLSDSEKKEKIFGDVYNFAEFIKANTENNSKILLLINDGMYYYYSRYDIYPRRIIWADTSDELKELMNKDKFNYAVIYDKKINLNGYEQKSVFFSKKLNELLILYKHK